MIVICTTSNRAAWNFLAEAQASGFAFTCWGSPGDPFHWMRSDNDVGGRLAAQHLIACGRRRFAFVGPQRSPQRQFDERRDGFTAAPKAGRRTPRARSSAASRKSVTATVGLGVGRNI